MKKLLKYSLLLIPLLVSCQQEYNSKSYDEQEKKLRVLPDTISKIILGKDWEKRDSLTYLRFKSLKQVYFIGTDSIPLWVTKFENLKQIQIMKEGNIKYLPNNIGNLYNLNYLNCSNNKIKEIPNSIKNLKKLIGLSLNNNELTYIPEEIGELKDLSYLFLSDNKISSIPISICRLKNLTKLDISNNKISVLPTCIGELVRLEELSLNGNSITELPEEIFTLPNLTSINIDNLPLNNKELIKEKINKLTYSNWIKNRKNK